MFRNLLLLLLFAVVSNFSMFEGRRVGTGHDCGKKMWSTAPLHLDGLFQELTQIGRFTL